METDARQPDFRHAHDAVWSKTSGTRREAMIASLVPFFTLPLALMIDPDTFFVLFVTGAGRLVLAAAFAIWLTCTWFMHKVCSHPV